MLDTAVRDAERALAADPNDPTAQAKLNQAQLHAGLTRWRLPLRGYQNEAMTAWKGYVAGGGLRGIIALPTGTGKTACGLAIAEQTGRTLWLAHREELCQQPLERLTDAWPDCRKGLIRGRTVEAETAQDVVVASVASLADKEPRLGALRLGDPIKLIVIDEVHHAIAGGSYDRVLKEFPGVPALGLTATVERGDGLALDTLWDKVVFSLQVAEAIKLEALAPPVEPFDVLPLETLQIDHEKVKSERDLEKILETRFKTPGVLEGIAEATAEAIVRRLSERKSVLIFTVLVRQAELTAEALVRRGWKAAMVSGETKRADRAELLKSFCRGEIRALANAQALTEGTDLPPTDAVVMARPFVSRTLFVQAMGRATRLCAGKENWKVLDLSGCTRLHDFMAAAPVLVGDPEPEGEGENNGGGGGGGEFKIANTGPPPPPVHWVKWKHGLVAEAGGDLAVAIRFAVDAGREIFEVWQSVDKVLSPVEGASYHDLDLAQGVGRDLVRRLGGKRARFFAAHDANWRSAPASESQIKTLNKIHFKGTVQTKGEAADVLTSMFTRFAFDRLKLKNDPVPKDFVPKEPKKKPTQVNLPLDQGTGGGYWEALEAARSLSATTPTAPQEAARNLSATMRSLSHHERAPATPATSSRANHERAPAISATAASRSDHVANTAPGAPATTALSHERARATPATMSIRARERHYYYPTPPTPETTEAVSKVLSVHKYDCDQCRAGSHLCEHGVWLESLAEEAPVDTGDMKITASAPNSFFELF